MPQGSSGGLLGLLFVLSLVSFVGSLIVIPWILVRLPSGYFAESEPRSWMKNRHPVLRIVGLLLKNLLGAVFVLAGIAMLVLPGQGILTMLIGVSLIDFPGKRALERKIIARPIVLNAINGLRHRFNRPPLAQPN
jgi:putative transmembrane protein PGPGW